MKLSIIVPIYNLENYISITIESLLKINFSYEYEILLINDGSTDQSENIINRYKKEYNCIRVISTKNNGVSYARNLGIKEAKGEYISFVDGDDTVNSDFFEIAIQNMELGEYDFVQGNFEIIKNQEAFLCQNVKKDLIINNTFDMYKFFFSPNNKIIHNAVWGKVYKAELLKNTKFDCKLRVSEDQKYIFDLLRNCRKIKLLNLVGVRYIQREASVMHTLDEKKIKDKITVLNYCKGKVRNSEIDMYIEWYILNSLIELYRFYVLTENKLSNQIYKEICEKENLTLRKYNSRKTNLIFWVLVHIRFVYDFYVKYKGRNEYESK